MFRRHWVVSAGMLATLLLTTSASAFYHDFFPTTVDCSLTTYVGATGNEGGYAIAGDGSCRWSKADQQFPLLGFYGPGDRGPDGLVNTADEVPLAEYMLGKKVVGASLYMRDASNNFCTPTVAAGTYLNDPMAIIALRISNSGPFVDRSTDGTGVGGCCAPYDAPLLKGGENAALAWRMGPPPYPRSGDAGVGAEWYKLSSADSNHPGEEVNATKTWFDHDGDGFGGLSGIVNGNDSNLVDGLFAIEYIVRHSDALIVNTSKMGAADCTANFGGAEPRDKAADGAAAFGWYASRLDRALIHAMAFDPECKGLTMSSIGVDVYLSPIFYTWDQSGGGYGPYVDLWCTLAGDVDNNACVNIFDLLDLAAAWNSAGTDTNYDPEADFNLDGTVNIFDLLALAGNWNQCAPAQN